MQFRPREVKLEWLRCNYRVLLIIIVWALLMGLVMAA